MDECTVSGQGKAVAYVVGVGTGGANAWYRECGREGLERGAWGLDCDVEWHLNLEYGK